MEDLLSLKILSHKKAYLSEMTPTYSYLCYTPTLDYGTHQPRKTPTSLGLKTRERQGLRDHMHEIYAPIWEDQLLFLSFL